MIDTGPTRSGTPNRPGRDSEMQAAAITEHGNHISSPVYRVLFDRFWDEVAPLNNFSPEAARALLSRETRIQVSPLDALNDPMIAVQAALSERAAGRLITRSA